MKISNKTLLSRVLSSRILALAYAPLLVLASTLLSPAVWADIEVLDKVIAIVDSDIVTEVELEERTAQIIESNRGNQLPPKDVLRQQILDRLIIESIQLQMGKRAGVRISDAQLTEAMDNIAKNNGMDLPSFKRAMEKDGISYEATRSQIRKEMVISQVQQGNINHRIQITDQEVENYLSSEEGKQLTAGEYQLLHILLPLPGKATPEQQDHTRKLAEQLQQELSSGKTNFASIKAQTLYQGNTVQSSDLGWRKAGDLPSIFADIAPRLKSGEVAAPIRSGSGFHIIILADKKGGEGQLVKQTRARHILIKPSQIRSEEQARKFVAQLRQRIIEGEDFVDLAKQYSEDTGSALQGGDLGWANPGQFVPAFETNMNQLDIDEISEPFKSQFGWHILQVLERRNQDISELRWQAMARNMIHQRKFQEELQNWLIKIRDEAFVEFK